jgi:hypothetical protein
VRGQLSRRHFLKKKETCKVMERFSVSSNPQLLDVSQIPNQKPEQKNKWWLEDPYIPGSIP